MSDVEDGGPIGTAPGRVLLTVPELAELLHRSPAQIRWMRHNGSGPPSAVVAGRIMYRRTEVEAWLDEQFAQGRTGS